MTYKEVENKLQCIFTAGAPTFSPRSWEDNDLKSIN